MSTKALINGIAVPVLLLQLLLIKTVFAYNAAIIQSPATLQRKQGSRLTSLSFLKRVQKRSKYNFRLHTFQNDASLIVSVGGIFDDDLPNILGINPLEATILFGLLYFFYGPTQLYEWVREAGKLFATYGPIVKDVSLDIFNEFRDYLEENRDREMLSKSGVDISKIPRRTSNIFERFQMGMQVKFCKF